MPLSTEIQKKPTPCSVHWGYQPATLAALFERVRDDGPIDAEALVDEEIPAREIGYVDAGSFWLEVARDALLLIPSIDLENGGEETWDYDHDAALRAVHKLE